MKTTKERILLYSFRCNKPVSRLLSNNLLHAASHGRIALLLVLLSGCVPPPVVRNENPTFALAETTADYYLEMLYRFNNAAPHDQAVLYERISTDAVLEPTAQNRLRLALLKAWPGHPGYNPEAAQQMLQTALLQNHELTPEVENLARVYTLIIGQQQQALNRSRTLATELEEAHKKLEALTTIERTVETPSPRAEVAP